MAPPPSTVVSPVVTLIVRVLTFTCLLISVIIIATNKATSIIDINLATNTATSVEMKFSDFYAYRYMLASGVIGMAYTVLQIAFTIFYVSSGNRFGGDGLTLLEFYGDKVLSYLLATGAAACFGLTVDLNRLPENDSEAQGFLNKANAAASLLFIGFIFSAISSVFSSLSLPKRG
ncbi:hypothetical protein ACJIZ3_022368 [Penstemon smallii]|uniref:CASP-like protein n=1 Tax=Penstemon smallii TaxID=265156 RepID=A0ABD3TLY9_9LAMI